MTWSRKNLEDVGTLAPTTSVYLTPERQEIQRTARAFAMEEVLPLADELDPQRDEIWRDARLTTIFEGTSEIQRKIVSDALVSD